MPEPKLQNSLLLSMPHNDLNRLIPHLEPFDLPKGIVLAEPWRMTDYAYFIDTGLASVIIEGANGKAAEIHMYGREGCGPMNILLSTPSLPFKTTMQVGGRGHRIPASRLASAMEDSMELRHHLTRFVQAAHVQTACTAYANANARVDERLARWILMCHDRCDGDDIPITHDFLSIMLSTRRQGVTTSLHLLEGKHLIRSKRSLVVVLDRNGLKEVAGDYYGVPERAYERLFPNQHALVNG